MPSSSRLSRPTLRVRDDPRNQPLGPDVVRDLFVLEELAMAGLKPLRDVRVEGRGTNVVCGVSCVEFDGEGG